MNATDLCYAPATELAAMIRARTLSPVELTRAVLERIARLNPTLNAFCTVTADLAMDAAGGQPGSEPSLHPAVALVQRDELVAALPPRDAAQRRAHGGLAGHGPDATRDTGVEAHP